MALNRSGETLAVGTANETEVYSLTRTPRYSSYMHELDHHGDRSLSHGHRRWHGAIRSLTHGRRPTPELRTSAAAQKLRTTVGEARSSLRDSVARATGDASVRRRMKRSRTFGADMVSLGEWPEPMYTCEPLALYQDLLAQQGTVALSDHLLAVGAAKRITVVDLNTHEVLRRR